jgi:hypothetical protein
MQARDLWHHPTLIDVDALLGQLPGLIKAIDNAHWHFHWLPLLVGEVQQVLGDQAVGAEVTLLHSNDAVSSISGFQICAQPKPEA